MAQRGHQLVEHALAGFNMQVALVGCRGGGGFFVFQVDDSLLEEILLPRQRFDLQRFETLRISTADAVLEPCDAFGVRVDDREYGPPVFWGYAACQLLDSLTKHFYGDIVKLLGAVPMVRGEQR